MSSTRPRRTERKTPAERRSQIGRAAAGLALDSGLHALTLRSVAEAAGVTPGLVAHYEPSVEELISATFAGIVSTELTEVIELVGGSSDPLAELRLLIDTLRDPGRQGVTGVWVDAWSLGRRSPRLAETVRRQMECWQDFVRDIIERGVAHGYFRTADADAVAWQLIGMVDGLNAQSLVRYRDDDSRGRLLARALEQELGLARGSLDPDEETVAATGAPNAD